MDKEEMRLRRRCKNDLMYFMGSCLKILTKGAKIEPLKLNAAQRYFHERIEKQKAETGRVRAMVLKGRQQGISTYTEGRFYHQVIHNFGIKAYILTHKADATQNIFAMVHRYHQNNNPLLKPHVGKQNESEFLFDRLDSRYNVSTAGSKGGGRSATIHRFHGSEVAFWDNAEEHIAGALQAVPDVEGTEVILESTANGVGNKYHEMWQAAEAGLSQYIAVFIPWFWQEEYSTPVPDDFEVSYSKEDVPAGELTEAEYQSTYKITDEQIYWRRVKIADLGYWKFKQEYPATSAEAFQTTGEDTFIPLRSVLKARKSDVATTDGPLIIGVDPAGGGSDRTAIIKRIGRKAYGMATFSKLDTNQVEALCHRIIMQDNPDRMFIDVGFNPGIYDVLTQMSGTQGVVVGVNFGSSTLYPDKYKNKRAEMYDLMKQWLEDDHGANIPDEDELQADLLAPKLGAGFTWHDANNLLKIESKMSMRSRGIRSPDLADALALTFAFPVQKAVHNTVQQANTEFNVF